MTTRKKDIDLTSNIAFRFKSLREKIKLSQEEVYNDTGIHISRIESGNANLTITTLSILCRYYKISLSDFFLDLD